jgi:hypothetical protein
MHKSLLFAFALIFSGLVNAQNMSVKSFRMLENDLSAQVYHTKIDQNGHKAALIKMVTTQTGFEFDGGSLGIVAVEQKTAEVWIYVPYKAKALTIKHPQLGLIRNYVYPLPIEAGRTYEMELVAGTIETIVKPIEIATQWLVITSDPSDADVYINDQPAGKTTYQNELPVGRYTWRVSRELYLSEAGVVELKEGNQKETINLKLKPNYGSISVTTNPEVNARVLVNGMEVNKTTPCLIERIPTGDVTLSANVDFYRVESQSFTLNPGQNLQVALKANPTFGTITLTSSPENGAAVSLDGMPTGKTTPCTLEKIPAGEHNVSLSREWFETTTRRVTIEQGQMLPLAVEMNPTFSEISIKTEPPSDIYINGDRKGNGTWQGRLNPAVYTFEARLDKHTTATEKQTVVVGKPLNITLNPKPKLGTLKVVSNPVDATLTLNGVNRGTTPITIRDLLIGNYSLSIDKSGYNTVTKTITIEEGKTTEVNETLPSGMEITVVSTPPGVQFSINNSPQGTTPKTLTLGFGSYSIKLVNGTKVVEETIQVAMGGKSNFEFNVVEGMNVTITSNPTGASLTVDGVYEGTTPITLNLSFGNHSVKLVSGKKVVEETITVSTGKRSKDKWEFNVEEDSNLGTKVTIPCSDEEFYSDRNNFRGTGMGASADLGTARRKAALDANATLATAISRTFKTVIDRYSNDSEFAQKMDGVVRTSVNQSINDAKKVCDKTFQKDGKYVVYVAVEVSKQAMLEKFRAQIKSNSEFFFFHDYDGNKFESILSDEMVKLEKDHQ